MKVSSVLPFCSPSLAVIPTLAPHPAMNRPKIINPLECPTGQMAFQKIYQMLQTSQIGFRPWISDKAAMRNGANANPSRKIENATCISATPMPKSCAIGVSAAAIILVVMMVTNWLRDTMIATVIFRVEDQL